MSTTINTRKNKNGVATAVKLTRKAEVHNGLQLKDGLNVDPIPLSPQNCAPGGIYYCAVDDVSYWLDLYGSDLGYVRQVTVPDDAVTHVEDRKRKSDKIVLGPRMAVGAWLAAHPDVCMAAVTRNGLALQRVTEQTPELCMAAVSQYWGHLNTPRSRHTSCA